jgi:hypothetical protein
VGSFLKRYVSFYFTNFPAQLSKFYLWKGFEVCGILEDVYVAKKRNRFGEPYGFVKFSNVRNITKMTKALNAVWFGQFCVRAKVAKFERNDTGVDEKLQQEKIGSLKGLDDPLKKDDIQIHSGQALLTGGDVLTKSTIPKTVTAKKGPGPSEGVRVGDIVVKLGARQEHVVQKKGQKNRDGHCSQSLDTPVAATQEKESSLLARNYRTKSDDVQWAHNGLVATVINGEAIPVVQNRITDAGFNNVEVIPMGADKVFV